MVVFVGCKKENKRSDFNLDFEIIEKGFPVGWSTFGGNDYLVGVDSLNYYHGKSSAFIEFDGESPDFKALEFKIPDNYAGEKITLTGFIKTENVADGFAGLWMRIDPGIAFENMNSRGLKGTNDWEKYEITLDMNPANTKQIVFGGLLAGKGKIWIDKLTLTIDGKNIEEILPIEKKEYLAPLDKAFDEGSTIVISKLNSETIENLELLGKIWGFLKYYHPKIADGTYNWDYELFRFLPEYLYESNHTKRDKLLIKWIDSLGKVRKCDKCLPTKKDSPLKPDLSWIDNQSTLLKNKLDHIYKNRSQGNHYYIEMAMGIGNPAFTNENSYSNMLYPDDGFRLLSLFRYWNMINYFFPYKHLIDDGWDSKLKEYLPIFIDANNELDYQLAVLQLISEIQDSHASLNGAHTIDEWKGKYYAPFQVRFIEDKLTITDFYNPQIKSAMSSKLEVGDILTKINGKTIESIVEEKLGYYPESNLPRKLLKISSDILRSNSSEIEIEYIKKNGATKTEKLQLHAFSDLKTLEWARNKTQKSHTWLDKNIGYINLQTLRNDEIPSVMETFEKSRGIIIDIRNYPADFVPFSLGGFFVSSPTEFVKFTNGTVDHPGEFIFTEPLLLQPIEKTYSGKVIVLVNEESLSLSEYTAMALRAGQNTTIIGSNTAGADGNISQIPLPGGLFTLISGIGVYYPDGTETQRVGIIPDIKITPSIKGVREGRDEILEKAIEIIAKK